MPAWQYTAQSILSAALFFCLLHLSYTDLVCRLLPNRQVIVVAVLGLARCLLAVVDKGSLAPMGAAALGALYAVGAAVLVAGIYGVARGRSGLGMGDLKLLAALGLFFGPRAFWLLPLASGFCVASLPLIALKREKGARALSLTVPFGPYIAIGAVILMMTAPIIKL